MIKWSALTAFKYIITDMNGYWDAKIPFFHPKVTQNTKIWLYKANTAQILCKPIYNHDSTIKWDASTSFRYISNHV